MISNFEKINPESIQDNTFKLIGSDWMLITAGSLDHYNTMTASWGGFGVLWGRNVCFCVVRPQRYTYEFMESEKTFTLTFFEDENHKALAYCGAHSGRDVDKAEKTGLTAIESNTGMVTFQEARLVIECKKIYHQDLDPSHFIDKEIDKNYPNKDYHRMYIGEIMNCYIKKAIKI